MDVVNAPPPLHVLAEFGVGGMRAESLEGGQGTSWLAGDLVFKPAADVELLELQSAVGSRVSGTGLRFACPQRSGGGRMIVDGWSATRHLAGRHYERRWPEVIAIGERFHAALAGMARPGFLARRDDPWAIGDRVAWGELPASRFAQAPHVRRLAAAIRPVAAASQLVHGDLTGNVLFHQNKESRDELPPAIIDLSPYWRPPAFASAIVVADALIWEGGDERLLGSVSHLDNFGQYLVRALIYRAVAGWLLSGDGQGLTAWQSAVELSCELAAGRD